MAAVRFESVSKVFPGGTAALDGLDLEIADGELVALVGPSGCGKTTALRILAGLEELTSGSVRIGGRSVDHLPPRDRDVAMVFQSYALYPHLTVARNIGFPLRLRRMPPDEIDRRVREAARILDLEPLLDRKPGQLSGGQRQRVAMGRAIVRQPSLFLMDEPLSNLDAKLRVQMRAEIARLQRRLGVTTVYVTHDQVEAMTMGDRVAVLNAGRLQQFDAPRALYERPANMFVAGFIGSPPMNLFEATLEGGEDGVDVRLGDQTVRLPRGVLAGRPGLRGYLGSPVAVGIRPEDVFESGRGTPGGGATLRVDVDLVEALGAETIIHFRLGAPAVVPVGDSDDIGGGGGGRGAARFDARTQVGPGQTVEVTVDPERLHFFDPATSEAVR